MADHDQTAVEMAKGWNYSHLTLALVVAFIAQSTYLPCLCNIGEGKIRFALLFDAIVLIRIVVARVMRQADRGWVFYAILIYSSPAWIELGGRIVLGPH